MNNNSRIMKCSCGHAEQDRINGAGMRHHNEFTGGYRCIVCGKEKTK